MTFRASPQKNAKKKLRRVRSFFEIQIRFLRKQLKDRLLGGGGVTTTTGSLDWRSFRASVMAFSYSWPQAPGVAVAWLEGETNARQKNGF